MSKARLSSGIDKQKEGLQVALTVMSPGTLPERVLGGQDYRGVFQKVMLGYLGPMPRAS